MRISIIPFHKEILSIFAVLTSKSNWSRKICQGKISRLYPALRVVTSLARAKYNFFLECYYFISHRKPFFDFALVSFMVQHTNLLECCRSLRSAVFHLDAVLWLSK